jgi:uncharacterized membrane protein
MYQPSPTPFDRLIALIIGNFSAPRGGWRILVALLYGCVCHAIFAVAVIAMIVVMYTGMTVTTALQNGAQNNIVVCQKRACGDVTDNDFCNACISST